MSPKKPPKFGKNHPFFGKNSRFFVKNPSKNLYLCAAYAWAERWPFGDRASNEARTDALASAHLRSSRWGRSFVNAQKDLVQPNPRPPVISLPTSQWFGQFWFSASWTKGPSGSWNFFKSQSFEHRQQIKQNQQVIFIKLRSTPEFDLMPPMDANLLIVIVRTVRSIDQLKIEINRLRMSCRKLKSIVESLKV